MSLGNIILSCEVVKAGEPTASGLIYSEEILEKAVAKIDKPIMGIVDSCPTYGRINMDMLSHEVDNIYVNSNGKVTGHVRILDTTFGKTLKEYVDKGLELTLVPNFMAKVEKGNIICDNLTFNSINIGITDTVKQSKQY